MRQLTSVGMFMGANATYLMYFRGSVDKIQKYEWAMISFAFLAPTPLALFPLFGRPLGERMYGDSTLYLQLMQMVLDQCKARNLSYIPLVHDFMDRDSN
jgi:hypothetical protein